MQSFEKLQDTYFKCLQCNYNEEADELIVGVDCFERDDLLDHARSYHNSSATQVCDWCFKVFMDKCALDEHIKQEHSVTSHLFACDFPECEREFLDPRVMRVHRRSHIELNEKSHMCNECNRRFSCKKLLNDHMNVHQGKRPHKCTLCPKDFASKYTLSAHMKTHADRTREFNCSTCDMSFFTQANLTAVIFG